MMYKPNFEPQVFTKVKDSGVELTIRCLCNPRKRRASTQDIWENILKDFKQNKIDFAYPTIRYYDNKTES